MRTTIKISQAKDLISKVIKAKLVAMLSGSPGVGKSAIIHEIAREYGLKVIDMRLAQCDPTDILGFPGVDEKTGKAFYRPMSTFPLETDTIPDGYNGWLLFLDEFRSAPKGVQAAAYKLVLDRMVGDHHLHNNVAIVCAGNLDTDNAIVEEMSTALQSRLIHLELAIDSDSWINWATQNGIDHRITSFIKFKPEILYTFKPDHTDQTYASPRTWEFANRFVKDLPEIGNDIMPLLAGTLSEGVAREFSVFCRIYKDLPTIAQISMDPTGIPVPTEPSILYALTGSIGNAINEKNIDALMKYIVRLPIEFQVITLREIVRRKKDLLSSPAIQAWVSKNATELF